MWWFWLLVGSLLTSIIYWWLWGDRLRAVVQEVIAEGKARLVSRPVATQNFSNSVTVIPAEVPPSERSTELPTFTEPQHWDFTAIVGSHKRERITRLILETLFQRPFPSIRPPWLTNPQTGRSLEIDCYNEELNLACEVSGAQHYEENNLHKDRREFLKQVYRDRIKKEQLLDRGVDFLVVPYTIPIGSIPSYVIQCLESLGYKRRAAD